METDLRDTVILVAGGMEVRWLWLPDEINPAAV